jgi:hypothetical protein
MKSTKTASQLGFDAPATIISGGELDLRWVELSEENLATIHCLIQKALIEKGDLSMSFAEDYDIDLFTSEELRDVNDAFNLCLGV